jgi:translation initiation factor IF-2
LIETVRQKTAALLPPKIEYRVIGEANVLQVFEVTKGKTKVSVAGCRVSNGNITRTDKVRVLRGPERTPVFEGESTWN